MADAPELTEAAQSHSKEEEIYAQRVEKAARWRELGANPFGNGHRPGHVAAQVHEAHGSQSAEEIEKAGAPVYDVAGRVVALRSFGKAAFIKLRDRSGEVQVHVKLDALGAPTFELFKLCDLGDFVAATGAVFRSKTGELTLAATRFVPLTKSFRPLPEKWHGLVDVEQRFQLWRFRHMKTVHRIIGERQGTGGSSGVGFLRKALELQFFPELWSVRTELAPPAAP